MGVCVFFWSANVNRRRNKIRKHTPRNVPKHGQGTRENENH